MTDFLILIPEIFIVVYSLGLFLAKHPYYIITEKRFYDRGNPAGRATQMFLETGLNKFTIIQHPQARFLWVFKNIPRSKQIY